MTRSAVRPSSRGLLHCSTLAVLVFLTACAGVRQPNAPASSNGGVERSGQAGRAEDVIAALQGRFAPDRRVARFDVTAREDAGVVILAGETTSAEARDELVRQLSALSVAHRDEIMVLPDAALGAQLWAIANNAVSNHRTAPGHSAELSTQLLLGTPMRVLRREGGFYLVQSPDRYLSWVDGGGIHRVTEPELRRYTAAPKIMYVRHAGVAYSAPSRDAEPVADLVLGALLEHVEAAGDWYRARMPDGRDAYVARAEATAYEPWAQRIEATESRLVETARTLIGRPYLWGGTSANGMDCSGFTRTVYLMNGIILPRDASQQVHAGTLVDDRGDFAALRPGDLLFFGRAAGAGTPERVVHVGMWIGDGRFIHSSGRVLVNSVDPAAPDYDEHNHGRYLRAKRILGSMAGVKLLRDGGLYTF